MVAPSRPNGIARMTQYQIIPGAKMRAAAMPTATMPTKVSSIHQTADGSCFRVIWKTSQIWWYQRRFFGFGSDVAGDSDFRAMVGQAYPRSTLPRAVDNSHRRAGRGEMGPCLTRHRFRTQRGARPSRPLPNSSATGAGRLWPATRIARSGPLVVPPRNPWWSGAIVCPPQHGSPRSAACAFCNAHLIHAVFRFTRWSAPGAEWSPLSARWLAAT